MDEQPATLQGVTVAEAAAILGVSTATVRRMVKRGQLEGTRVHRPQGTAFVITMPVDAAGDTQDATDTRQEAGVTPRGNASPSEQLAAWSETFLVPLVAALERSQATVREQAERIGELRATVAAQDARIATLVAPTSRQGAELSTGSPAPWWLSPWPYGASAALAAVVAIMATIGLAALAIVGWLRAHV